MKVVIIGGTGLIGSKLVDKLRARGHRAVAASPDTGVDTVTGEGLAGVMRHSDAVVDVSNSPSLEDRAVLAFFETSTRNILDAEVAAGVRHHVALSVVGTERMTSSAYFRAKAVQEKLIETSAIPYSIVHATQFFEFVTRIADAATEGETVRVAPVLVQPIAAEDVAGAVCRIAVADPLNGTVEVAGPLWFRLDDLVRRTLSVTNDPRHVVADPHARYFGADLDERTLLPDDDAQLTTTHFPDWLARRSAGG